MFIMQYAPVKYFKPWSIKPSTHIKQYKYVVLISIQILNTSSQLNKKHN